MNTNETREAGKDRKAKRFENGKRIRTHAGKLRPGRKKGRERHPEWNTRSKRN